MYDLVLPQTENQNKNLKTNRRSREKSPRWYFTTDWYFTCHNKLFLYAFYKLSIYHHASPEHIVSSTRPLTQTNQIYISQHIHNNKKTKTLDFYLSHINRWPAPIIVLKAGTSKRLIILTYSYIIIENSCPLFHYNIIDRSLPKDLSMYLYLLVCLF